MIVMPCRALRNPDTLRLVVTWLAEESNDRIIRQKASKFPATMMVGGARKATKKGIPSNLHLLKKEYK